MSREAIILDTDELVEILSTKKEDVLKKLYRGDYNSIKELADELNRDYSVVNKDVKTLEELGVVELVEEKGSMSPRLVNSDIRIDSTLDLDSLVNTGYLMESDKYSSELIKNQDGVLIGETEEHSIYLDRWSSDLDNYNQVTIGKIGSGKSYSTQLNILRTYIQEDDLKIFTVSTVGGYEGITRMLGGETIRFKSNKNTPSVNPLDLSIGSNRNDVYTDNVSFVLHLIREHLNRILTEELTDYEEEFLMDCIHETYSEFAIDEDSYNREEQPEISDLIKKVREKYLDDDQIRSELGDYITDFKDSKFSFLNKETSFDISEKDIVNFDCSGLSGTGLHSSLFSLIMKEVYHESIRTDKKVLFVIEESFFIMDSENNSTLDTILSKGKEIDLSVNLVSQGTSVFKKNYLSPENISIRLFHRYERAEDMLSESFNLNDEHVDYITDAYPGSEERGYSEALFGVKGKGYVPIKVIGNQDESQLIHMESKNMTLKEILED